MPYQSVARSRFLIKFFEKLAGCGGPLNAEMPDAVRLRRLLDGIDKGRPESMAQPVFFNAPGLWIAVLPDLSLFTSNCGFASLASTA